MQIYWIHDGRRCGPATVPDVLSMVQLGELTPDTQGWHVGCTGWAPLRELPALADFLTEPQPEPQPEAEEPPTPENPPAPEQAEQTGSAPSPAADTPLQDERLLRALLPGPVPRLVARMIDYALYATLLLGAMYMLHVPYNPYLTPASPFFWAPAPLLEALLLYTTRTTPGKLWVGIRLHSLQAGLSFTAALVRSILVLLLGLGFMMFPITIITLLLSYFSIMRRGITLWDLRTSTLPVLSRPPSLLNIIAAAFFLLWCAQLCGRCMLPWLPDMPPEMMQTLQDYFPNAAQILEETVRQTPRP